MTWILNFQNYYEHLLGNFAVDTIKVYIHFPISSRIRPKEDIGGIPAIKEARTNALMRTEHKYCLHSVTFLNLYLYGVKGVIPWQDSYLGSPPTPYVCGEWEMKSVGKLRAHQWD